MATWSSALERVATIGSATNDPHTSNPRSRGACRFDDWTYEMKGHEMDDDIAKMIDDLYETADVHSHIQYGQGLNEADVEPASAREKLQEVILYLRNSV